MCLWAICWTCFSLFLSYPYKVVTGLNEIIHVINEEHLAQGLNPKAYEVFTPGFINCLTATLNVNGKTNHLFRDSDGKNNIWTEKSGRKQQQLRKTNFRKLEIEKFLPTNNGFSWWLQKEHLS